MRTVFIHGEVDQFLEAKDAVIARFSTWCEQRELEAPVMLAEFLLGDKLVHDGLLVAWSEQELRRFLVDVVPRRLALENSWSSVIDFLHLWVDFLDDAQLLMSGGAPIRQLHAAIEESESEYLNAMADPQEWSPAKYWTTVMAEHAVDREDIAAVDRFFTQVENGELQVEREIVDHIENREEQEPVLQPAYWLPPMPDCEEGLVDAPATPIVARMRALCEWLGDGKDADELGQPVTTDLLELSDLLGISPTDTEITVEWAKCAHLIRHVGHRLVPTRILAPQLEQPTVLWSKLWQSFFLLDTIFETDILGFNKFDWGQDAFLEMLQQALRTLYCHPEAIPLELIVDMTLGAMLDDADMTLEDLPAPLREDLTRMNRRVFDHWEAMGVVRTFTTSDADQIELIDSAVGTGIAADHTMLELMPLGIDVARGSLQAFGFTAPSVESIVDAPAEVLVLALSDSPPEAIEDVLATWIEKRGRVGVGAQLADLLRTVNDPTVRVTALWLLERVGQEGVAAVRTLCSDPVVGPSARMWLQSKPGGRDVTTEPDDDLLYALDGMAVSAAESVDGFLAEFQAQSTRDQIAVVERIPRTNHVRAGAVLEVIAEGHPDTRVANMARRSLEKVG